MDEKYSKMLLQINNDHIIALILGFFLFCFSGFQIFYYRKKLRKRIISFSGFIFDKQVFIKHLLVSVLLDTGKTFRETEKQPLSSWSSH